MIISSSAPNFLSPYGKPLLSGNSNKTATEAGSANAHISVAGDEDSEQVNLKNGSVGQPRANGGTSDMLRRKRAANANSAPYTLSAATSEPASLVDFRRFVKQELTRKLNEAFQGQAFDPDQIHVNEYETQSGQRTTLSSKTLTDTMLSAIKDGAPAYDLSRFGLFRSASSSESGRILRQHRENHAQTSNALVDVEDLIAGVLHAPAGDSLEARYRAHVRQQQYPSASSAELNQLQEYDALRADDEETVNRLMGETSPRTYSRNRVQDYVQEQADTTIDSDNVNIIVEFDSAAGKTSSEQTLTDVVLQGPYAQGTRFKLAPSSGGAPETTAALTSDFLKQMLSELDVRSDYIEAFSDYIETLKKGYNNGGMASALTDAFDSRAQHAAYSAKLKGEITENDYQLIQRVRQTPDAPGSDNRVALGGVTMFGDDQLKDIQIYRETNPQDRTERYVMYAPGAPGKDFYTANTWYQLSQQLGGWTGTKEGRQYLTNQLDPGNRKQGQEFFDKVAQKPNEWKANLGPDATVHWKPFDGEIYRAQLGAAVAEKSHASVAEIEATLLPSWYANASLDERKQFNSLELAAQSAFKEYQSLSQPTPFQEFSHQEVKTWLNQRLREQGVQGNVDPDTVQVNLDGSGETIVNLTDLVTYGYRDHSGVNIRRAMKFTSTIGQDLSALNSEAMRGYISTKPRNAYLGTAYINDVKKDFLSAGPALERRREQYQQSAQLMMQRDALEAKLKGQLTDVQYQHVTAEIARLGENSHDTRGIYEFKLNDKIAHGVYTFRFSSLANTDLVYTAGAPDGITFRSNQEIKDLFNQDKKNLKMSRYLYDRFSYSDQKTESINRFLDDLHRNIPVNAEIKAGARLSHHFEKEYDRGIKRLTDNVDAITESRGEMIADVAKGVWNVAKYVGIVVTLPLPPASAAFGLLLAGEGIYNGVAAYRNGDRSAALEHFLGASWDLAGAAGDILGGGLKGAKGVVKALTDTPPRTPHLGQVSGPSPNAVVPIPGNSTFLEAPIGPPLASSNLNNSAYRQYAVPESVIAGKTANSRGIYQVGDHSFYVRHVDDDGNSAVYQLTSDVKLTEKDGFVRILNPETGKGAGLKTKLTNGKLEMLALPGGVLRDPVFGAKLPGLMKMLEPSNNPERIAREARRAKNSQRIEKVFLYQAMLSEVNTRTNSAMQHFLNEASSTELVKSIAIRAGSIAATTGASTAGALAGSAGGAALGSLIVPGIGTVAGGAIGGLVGGKIASIAAEKTAGKLGVPASLNIKSSSFNIAKVRKAAEVELNMFPGKLLETINGYDPRNSHGLQKIGKEVAKKTLGEIPVVGGVLKTIPDIGIAGYEASRVVAGKAPEKIDQMIADGNALIKALRDDLNEIDKLRVENYSKKSSDIIVKGLLTKYFPDSDIRMSQLETGMNEAISNIEAVLEVARKALVHG